MKENCINFLLLNGFVKTDENVYANMYCGVTFDDDTKQMYILDNSGLADHFEINMYILGGYLMCNNLIDDIITTNKWSQKFNR